MLSFFSKIPIKIYPFFWVLAIGIGWLNSMTLIGTAIWTIVIIISVVVHEYGHALTAMSFGQTAVIQLVGLGGVTSRHGPKLKLWQEFIIVMNGPLAGFLLAFLAVLIKRVMGSHPSSLMIYALDVTILVNIFWTVVNLLPIQPLDGGRLLSIIMEAIFGVRGIKISLFISILLSAVVGVFFFAIQAFLAGCLFLIMTYESYQAFRATLSMKEVDHNSALQQMLKDAEQYLREGNSDMAKQTFQKIRDISKSGVIYQAATENLANLFYEQGNIKEAYNLLLPLKRKLSTDALRLLHQIAYRTGDFKEAISVGDRSYQTYPSYDTALINALCYSLLGEVKPAIGWLQCAIRDGMPNLKAILAKPEFDSIRTNPLFQKLAEKEV